MEQILSNIINVQIVKQTAKSVISSLRNKTTAGAAAKQPSTATNLNTSTTNIIGQTQVQKTNPKVLQKIQQLAQNCETELQTFKIDGQDVEMIIYKGSQQGSNAGFWAKTKNGTDLYYLKFGGEAQLRSEQLASELYKLAGTESAEIKIVTQNAGNKKAIGLASKFLPFDKPVTLADSKAFIDGFGADCWLANWDAVAPGNAVMQGSKAVRLDVGGSLCYRAQGGRKGAVFGEDVKELTSFLSFYSHSRPYINNMTREELINSLLKVGNLSDAKIEKVVENAVYNQKFMLGTRKIVMKNGIKNPEFLKEILIARKNYIQKFAAKCCMTQQNPGETMADYIRRVESKMPKTQYKLPFNMIQMSKEVKEISGTSLAEHLLPSQKRLYEESYNAYLTSQSRKIPHNASDKLTTDNVLHATNFTPEKFEEILKDGITTGDLRALSESGTGVSTQTPLCADFWDVTKQTSIKDYFSKPLHEFAEGELKFLPAKKSSKGTNMVVVLNKKSASPTLMKNSFLVDGGETILRKDGNIGGHPYPTHRAVPYGMPANCIDRIIVKREWLPDNQIAKIKEMIQKSGLDIKVYDLDGNIV